MELGEQESEEIDVEETDKEGLCIVHMKNSNLQSFTFLCNTKDKDGRFEKIKEIGRLRMAQPSNSTYWMESICVGLPTVLEHHYGYHRDCYQRFTANLKRLQPEKEASEQSYGKRVKRRESSQSDKVLFTPDRIYL